MADLKARSRKKWRDLGYHVENGEYIMRVPGGIVRRQDTFGFADLIALPLSGTPDPFPWPQGLGPECASYIPMAPEKCDPWVYIQSTSWANVSTRLRKIQEETTGRGQWARPIADLARAILYHGDMIVIEGWRKEGGRYEERERWITLDDLEG